MTKDKNPKAKKKEINKGVGVTLNTLIVFLPLLYPHEFLEKPLFSSHSLPSLHFLHYPNLLYVEHSSIPPNLKDR